MKKQLLVLCMSLFTISAFANNAPLLSDLKLGNFSGRDIISECNLSVEENSEGKIVATFNKGGLTFKSTPMNPDLSVMVSSNQQVWVTFHIEGMIHVNLMLDNETDLNPSSYVVLEGRSNTVYKCRNLK